MCPCNRKDTHTHTHTHTHIQGGITALVTAMGRHAASPGVQEQAAFALRNLAVDAENQSKIGAQVELTHGHMRICVSSQSRARTHTHTHTHTQGGIEALVAAMGRHPANAGVVQEHAVWALYYLTTGFQPTTFSVNHGSVRLEPPGATRDLNQRIKQAGVLEAVRRAMAAPGATANTMVVGPTFLHILTALNMT
jgi:hypothetical protein